jgi:molybdate transport system permease protein
MSDAKMTEIILVTAKLAFVTTFILLVVSPPIAWWLSQGRSWTRSIIEALVSLPLVLPPTVLGFYLLLLMAPDALFGRFWMTMTGTPLSFSFSALVVGSVLYSLPFVVQPLHNAFRQIPQSLLETAATLGAAPFDRFVSVVVPFCKKSFITASCLGFAHTVGEFGVVLMIGGNIPGETQVLSIALFDAVERLDFAGAHLMAGGLMAFSLLSLIMIYRYNSRTNVGL